MTASDRRYVIEKIDDMRNKDSFPYYKEKFFIPNKTTLSDEVLKKLFIDTRMMNKVIEAFVSFCPILKTQIPKSKSSKKYDKKVALIKEALKVIDWKSLNHQIYDMLESEGDVFLQIYFKNEEDKIPKLRLLESKKMTNILLDEYGEPVTYIYRKEEYEIEKVDYVTGMVSQEGLVNNTYIFDKGITYKVAYANASVSSEVENRDSYKDMPSIIRIPSKIKQNEKFSIIPAEDYINFCLQLAQIESDIRAVNRQMGFPRTILMDANIVEGSDRVGGYIKAESSNSSDGNFTDTKGHVIDLQLSNGLQSTFTEWTNVRDALYDIVGITNPSLLLKVGSSDSSKLYQQVNARMEQKIELYINNIIDAFIPYFKILLVENGLYEAKYDESFSFQAPEDIIKLSVYDKLLVQQLELNTGLKTITDLLKQKGYSSEKIREHLETLNTEVFNGEKDISTLLNETTSKPVEDSDVTLDKAKQAIEKN